MTDGSRILVVGLNYAPEHTGIAPYTTGMARGLAAAGHEVTVLAGFPYYPQWRIANGYRGMVRREADGAVSIIRLRHYVPGSSTGVRRIVHEASFAAHAFLRSVPGRGRPYDAVVGVSPSLLSTVAARSLARRWGVPFGVVVQDLYANAGKELGTLPGGAGRAVLAAEAAVLRAADGVAVVHEHFAATVRESHGVPAERVRVIRNWTHINADKVDRRQVRGAFGWPEDRVVVLHAGNMGAKQDLTSVVRAAELADERAPWVHFVLVGDGARRREVLRSAEGISTISVRPPVTEARFPHLLAAADVLLVNERPGMRTTAVPSKLTSYFAVGRPVIAASEPDSPASAELSASGAGIRVPPGDPDALLEAAMELGLDRTRSAELGANGRRYACAALGEPRALTAYRDWVADLLAGTAR